MKTIIDNNNFTTRGSCPACESASSKEHYSESYNNANLTKYLDKFYSDQGTFEKELLSGMKYTLIECLECHLIYQKEVPDYSFTNRLYNSWIDPIKSKKLATKSSIKNIAKIINNTHEIIRVIFLIGKSRKNIEVLDFGAGWCEWLKIAKNLGLNCYCCEISEARIKFAKSQNIHTLAPQNIKNKKFDYINAEQVFEHLTEPMNTLLDLKNRLKQEGIIKIAVPDTENVVQNFKLPATPYKKMELAPLEHINSFSHKSLINMAAIAGLKPIRNRRILTTSLVQILRRLSNHKKNTGRSTYIFFKNRDKANNS